MSTVQKVVAEMRGLTHPEIWKTIKKEQKKENREYVLEAMYRVFTQKRKTEERRALGLPVLT